MHGPAIAESIPCGKERREKRMSFSEKRKNLKAILEMYCEQEMKVYEKYDKMPPHRFSKEYREKMDNLMKKMEK